MKKLLLMMIALATLAVCLVAVNADDADADIDTGFWVNGEEITRDADASGTGWSYTKATNTLTLTDGTFSTNHKDQYDGGLFLNAHQRCSPIYYTYEDKLNIVLHGYNVIKDYGPGKDSGELSANGILIFGDLEISGDGALDVKGGGTNGFIIDGSLRISGGTITVGGFFDEFNIWATEDGRASSFTMTDGRLHILKNENPKETEQLLFYSDGNFTMSGGVIDTAGIIRGYDDTFTHSGGIIKNGSMKADAMLLEFGSFTYGSTALNNLKEVDSVKADNRKLVCIANGAASIGAEPAKKFIVFDANGGIGDKYSVETGEDGKIASLPDANRDDYNFVGWFTAAEGGDSVTTDTVFSEDTTVYAHWASPSSEQNNELLIGIIVAIGALAVILIAVFFIRGH